MKRPPPRNGLRHLLLLLRSDARASGGHAWLRSKGLATILRYRVRRARKYGRWSCRFLLAIELLMLLRRPSDAEIPSTAHIGAGFNLPHPQGVIISQNCRIGPHVTIYQQVTLGAWEGGIPRVKARAVLYAGAKAVGGVTIGRRCFVGANAVVIQDVPPWHSAVGVPAQAKRRKDVPDAQRTAFLKEGDGLAGDGRPSESEKRGAR